MMSGLCLLISPLPSVGLGGKHYIEVIHGAEFLHEQASRARDRRHRAHRWVPGVEIFEGDFEEMELTCARNFAAASASAGVSRIVYLGGVGLRRGRNNPTSLRVGEAVDFWRVERVDHGSFPRLRAAVKRSQNSWVV